MNRKARKRIHHAAWTTLVTATVCKTQGPEMSKEGQIADWAAKVRTLKESTQPAVYVADRITANPGQCGGRPCVRGMRIRVTDVLDLLAARLSPEAILDEMPDLEAEDITACLRFASRQADHPIAG